MRFVRWLLPVAILFIVYEVGVTYLERKRTQAAAAPAAPPPLEKDIEGRARDWVYLKTDGDRPVVEVRAKSFRQITEPSVMELEGLELHLFHKDGKEYDLVRSPKAQFDIPGKSLYSEADVEITMGVPVDGPPHGRVLKIHGSGVRFSSDTGKATTDRRGIRSRHPRAAPARRGFAGLARQKSEVAAHAHRGRGSVLSRARIQGDLVSVVQADARHATYGCRNVGDQPG